MNKYLEKIALTRLVKELAGRPELGGGVSKLVSKGFIRPEHVYTKGIMSGNSAIARKLNTFISNPGKKSGLSILPNFGGGAATTGPKNIFINKKNLKKSFGPSGTENVVRHELHEVRDLKEMGNKMGPAVSYLNKRKESIRDQGSYVADALNAIGLTPKNTRRIDNHMKSIGTFPGISFIKNHQGSPMKIGAHSSPGVLVRESNDLRANPYSGNLRGYREWSGEGGMVSKVTGKKFGVDKMTNKDVRKAQKLVKRDLPTWEDGTPFIKVD